MKSKSWLILSMFIFLFFYQNISLPVSVQAQSPTVIDWINEEESEKNPSTETETSQTTGNVGNKSFFSILVQLIFYTLIIIAMIYGLIKFLAMKQKNLQPNQAVQILAGTTLGKDRSLQIVKIAGKIYVLGVGESVTLIKEIDDEEEISQFEDELHKETTSLVQTKSLFDFSKWKNFRLGDNKSTDSFQKLFSQTLNKQKQRQQEFDQKLNDRNDDEERRSL